jgi:hypothetical protein
MPLAQYHRTVFEHKHRELMRLLAALGARRVRVRVEYGMSRSASAGVTEHATTTLTLTGSKSLAPDLDVCVRGQSRPGADGDGFGGVRHGEAGRSIEQHREDLDDVEQVMHGSALAAEGRAYRSTMDPEILA